ncbi:MAG: hypothetical protein Q8S84_04095 [bacterium]|nr:hypothetical protein [bacterium]
MLKAGVLTGVGKITTFVFSNTHCISFEYLFISDFNSSYVSSSTITDTRL